MKVLVVNDAEETVPESFLSSWVGEVVRELKGRRALPEEHENKELSLVFLKEMDAKQLNWNFRQKDYATDVLSFETEDPESLGELVLCPAVLKKQAKENKHTYELELGYMVLHGILHLLGHDHEAGEDQARSMMSLQDNVFEILRKPKKAPKAAKEKPAEKAKAKAPAKTAKAAAKKAAPVKAKAKTKEKPKPAAKKKSKK